MYSFLSFSKRQTRVSSRNFQEGGLAAALPADGSRTSEDVSRREQESGGAAAASATTATDSGEGGGGGEVAGTVH